MQATHTLTKFGVTKNVLLVRMIEDDEPFMQMQDEKELWCKVLVLDTQPYALIERFNQLIPIIT